jgi:cytoskeletal protein CcmA (bactofilin family)
LGARSVTMMTIDKCFQGVSCLTEKAPTPSGHLVIGKDGAVRGDIKADEVVVYGKTEGVIRARRIMLQESARVVGDIFYELISIEEGAQFIGASNQGKDEAMAQMRDHHPS